MSETDKALTKELEYLMRYIQREADLQSSPQGYRGMLLAANILESRISRIRLGMYLDED